MLQSPSLSRRGRRCSVLMPVGNPCCSTMCRPQTMKKFVFVQLKWSGWNHPHFLRDRGGTGGRLSSSLSAFRVSSLPGGTGDPSSAWWAAEISPNADQRLSSRQCPPWCDSFWTEYLLHFQTLPCSIPRDEPTLRSANFLKTIKKLSRTAKNSVEHSSVSTSLPGERALRPWTNARLQL